MVRKQKNYAGSEYHSRHEFCHLAVTLKTTPLQRKSIRNGENCRLDLSVDHITGKGTSGIDKFSSIHDRVHVELGGKFYSGSYPPDMLEGDFYTCANTKRDTELAKRALLEEKQEKHLGR